MRIGEIIRNYRKKNGMSVRAFADAAGVSRSYINTLEMDEENKRSLTLNKITSIAQGMGLSADDLISMMDDTAVDLKGSTHSRIPGAMPVPDLSALRSIPLLGSIACGEPIMANQEYETVEVDEITKADFCLRAKGDSMIDAGISDGSLVLCVNAEEVENGQIAAVIIDDEATLKRFYSYGETIVLRPCNPDYPEQVYSGEDLNRIRIIGRAVTCIFRIK